LASHGALAGLHGCMVECIIHVPISREQWEYIGICKAVGTVVLTSTIFEAKCIAAA
jgi:hypothetical protein